MSSHQRESAFLKSLIIYEDSEACREFHERLAKAEREAKCIKTAIRLVVLLGMFCISGLGYSSVLLEEFFRNKNHFVTQFFLGLGATSIIALLFFLAQSVWHRALIHRLHEECRRRIVSVVRSRLGDHIHSCPQPVIEEVDLKIAALHTSPPNGASNSASRPRVMKTA